jgi:hypothetical protein
MPTRQRPAQLCRAWAAIIVDQPRVWDRARVRCGVKTPCRVSRITSTYNVVSLEDAARLVPGRFHRDWLGGFRLEPRENHGGSVQGIPPHDRPSETQIGNSVWALRLDGTLADRAEDVVELIAFEETTVSAIVSLRQRLNVRRRRWTATPTAFGVEPP